MKWELVNDFRNCPLWDTETALRVPNAMALAQSLPAGITHLAPPALDACLPVCLVWSADDGAWQLAPDYSRRPLWNKADGSIADALPRGHALPSELTDRAPPMPHVGEITFDDSADAWRESDPVVVPPL